MTTSTLSSPIASGNMVPRTPGWPLVGALPALVRGPLDYLLQARATLGDIYRLDLGVTEIIALNHPRHAQHVLVDNARNYSKGGPIWDGLCTLIGNGLVVSEGAFFRRARHDLPTSHCHNFAPQNGRVDSAGSP